MNLSRNELPSASFIMFLGLHFHLPMTGAVSMEQCHREKLRTDQRKCLWINSFSLWWMCQLVPWIWIEVKVSIEHLISIVQCTITELSSLLAQDKVEKKERTKINLLHFCCFKFLTFSVYKTMKIMPCALWKDITLNWTWVLRLKT